MCVPRLNKYCFLPSRKANKIIIDELFTANTCVKVSVLFHVWTDCHWLLQKHAVAAVICKDIAVGRCKKSHCSSVSRECAFYR